MNDEQSLPEQVLSGVGREILQMERAALRRWLDGDPSGFLEISAPDVVYFDPYRERRVDGIEALGRLYEGLRGKISARHYEIRNPCAQHVGEAVVLTFQFVSWTDPKDASRWNCTEVYRRDPVGWRIIQSHWSYTWPPPKGYAD